MATVTQTRSGMNQKMIGGLLGDLEGGVVFGIMMAMMGMGLQFGTALSGPMLMSLMGYHRGH